MLPVCHTLYMAFIMLGQLCGIRAKKGVATTPMRHSREGSSLICLTSHMLCFLSNCVGRECCHIGFVFW